MKKIKQIGKQLLRKFLGWFKLDVTHTFFVPENDALIQREFTELYATVKPYTEASLERSYALFKAVEYISKNNIPGSFVECGVANAGSAMIVAKTLVQLHDTDRDIYLYDTYEGMPAPSDHDHLDGKTPEHMKRIWENTTDEQGEKNWMRYSIEQVKSNMESTGYRMDRIHFVKGMVEHTIPDTLPKETALLRLDTDFYESTKHELKHLYPTLSVGGVLLLDDYGTWMGEKKAVDEYFNNRPLLLNRVDRDGRIGVKITD